MHFERLKIRAFGPHRKLDTGPEPLPGFVVVTGPNEAGKSTFVEALRTSLYGFYPASRESHLLAPWDGTDAEIEAALRIRGGGVLEVHRRLLATPWGRLRQGGEEEDLRNRTVPGVGEVQRDTYRQVHHLTHPELLSLQEGSAWTLVRDRIMAGMGTQDLKPPREVVEALDEAARALWRPGGRGSWRDRELAGALEARGEALLEAREADRAFREAEAALLRDEGTLRALREEAEGLGMALDRVRTLLPLEARLAVLDQRLAEAGDRTELTTLPGDPAGRLEALEQAEREARGTLEEARAAEVRTREALEGVGPVDAELLALAPQVEALRGPVSDAERALGAIRERGASLRHARERLEERMLPLLVPEAVSEILGRESGPGDGSEPGSGHRGRSGPGSTSTSDPGPDPAAVLEARLARVPFAEVRGLVAGNQELRARIGGLEERRTQAEARLRELVSGDREEQDGASTEVAQGLRAEEDGETMAGVTEDMDVPPPASARATSTPWVLGGTGLLLLVIAFAFLMAERGGAAAPWLTLLAGAVLVGVALFLREKDRTAAALAREREARRQEREAAERARVRDRQEVRARTRDEAFREVDALGSRIQELEAEVAGTRSRIATYLEGIPVAPGRLALPAEALVTELEGILSGLRELRRLQEAERADRERIQEAEAMLRAVEARARVGGEAGDQGEASLSDHSGGAPGPRIQALLHRLEEAREGRRLREDRAREHEASTEALTRAERNLEAARAERSAFEERLRTLAGPGEGRPLDRVLKRLEAAADARRIQGELETSHGGLEALRTRIREARRERPLSDEEVARMAARLDELHEAVERTSTRTGETRATLRQMEGRETVDLVESEMERIREERDQVRREHDRLRILARVVQVAEQRFRERHQPELVRRAESILGALTGGRYDTLLLGDEGNPDRLQVRAAHLPGPTGAEEPLSTGTREQIWFSLRMAVVELVEGSGPPLPLVLDEVLVNWDRERRGRALELLAEKARSRQLFLVTCHPELAAEAMALGARGITLEGP